MANMDLMPEFSADMRIVLKELMAEMKSNAASNEGMYGEFCNCTFISNYK